MNSVLLTAGVVALIAAVIGGGLSAFNIEIPVLGSRAVRLGLGGLGVVFLVAAIVLREPGPPPVDDPGPKPPSPESIYQQRVLATCKAVRRVLKQEPVGPSDFQGGQPVFDRDAFLARGLGNVEAIARRLDLLLDKRVPGALKARADVVRRRADRFVSKSRASLDELRAALQSRFTIEELQEASAPLQDDADALIIRLADSMSELADRECTLRTS